MDSIDARFARAVSCVSNNKLGALPPDDMLKIYAWYKQGTIGECATDRPNGWFDATNKAKWDAWTALDDMPSETAKTHYADFVDAKLNTGQNPDGLDSNDGVAINVMSPATAAFPAMFGNALAPGFSTLRGMRSGNNTPSRPGSRDGPAHDLASIRGCVMARDRDTLERVAGAISDPEERLRALNAPDEDVGMTPLHWACDNDDPAMVKLLLRLGAKADALDKNGQSPLHYAALLDSEPCCLLLLSNGVQLQRTDKDGAMPVDLCTSPAVVKLLTVE